MVCECLSLLLLLQGSVRKALEGSGALDKLRSRLRTEIFHVSPSQLRKSFHLPTAWSSLAHRCDVSNAMAGDSAGEGRERPSTTTRGAGAELAHYGVPALSPLRVSTTHIESTEGVCGHAKCSHALP